VRFYRAVPPLMRDVPAGEHVVFEGGSRRSAVQSAAPNQILIEVEGVELGGSWA